jgi:hypothetical protein
MLFTGAAPPGGGRSVVTPRFTRHYNVFCVPPASEAVMKVIFESIFSGFMKPFDKDVQRLVGASRGVLWRCLRLVSWCGWSPVEIWGRSDHGMTWSP